MIQLIYASAASVDFSAHDLTELLLRARKNNESVNVTGMLVYQDGAFLQILEGEEEDVFALYDKISKDKRHSNVRMLLQSQIDERSFGDWQMGFHDASGSELKGFPGFSDFFKSGAPVGFDDTDRARSVLLQFRDGAWRQKVEEGVMA